MQLASGIIAHVWSDLVAGYCTFRDRAIGGLPAVIDSSFRTDLLDCARVVGSLETNQKRGSGRLARQRTWRHSAVYAITRRSRWHSPQSFRSNFGPIQEQGQWP